jgi:replicative DNA helicase
VSAFDYLMERGRAIDFRDARRQIAELSGVPIPFREAPPRRPPGGTPPPAGAPGAAPAGWAPEWVNSATFFVTDYRPRWLVTRLLAARQPAFAGGPSKSLKTSILIDLAVSLGSGTAFLGEFSVPGRVRVGVLSGESGAFTLQETARRICAARGTDPSDLDVLWGFRLPQLANPAHVECLAAALRENKVEVLILDPVYLALLAGDLKGLQASNFMETGPLLMSVAQACLDAGATPILVHHTRKNLTNPFEPIELNDLAFSGCAEFARQWLLINRREKFDPDGGGLHQLWMGVGGSTGQCGLWAVDVTEGQLEEDFTGRRWEVMVTKGGEARDKAKKDKQERKDKEEDGALLAVVDRLDPERTKGVGKTRLRENLGWSGDKVGKVLARLLRECILVECDVAVPSGKEGTRKVAGVKRSGLGPVEPPAQTAGEG